MIELLLKASFAIGIALLFYKLLLQQESFFTANRLYLLGCIALAFALPYVSLPKLVSQQGVLATIFEQKEAAIRYLDSAKDAAITRGAGEIMGTEIPEKAQQPEALIQPEHRVANVAAPATAVAEPGPAQEFGWGYWLTALYLFGVAVFTLSLLFQLGSILYKIHTATDKIQDGDCVIVNTASRQAPCSFFRYIFIYPDEYDFETYGQIIAHEKIHARLGHSFDLLIAELAVIILWFNPLVWLLRREIEKNNEYQTDAVLLEKEQVAREQYQFNLVQIAVPNKPLSITTNYNQSLLKQRIMMMNAKKSTPHAYWKYAFLLPVFFGTLLLVNEPAVSQATPNDKTMAMPAPEVTPNPTLALSGKEKLTGKIKEKVEAKVKEKLKESIKQQTGTKRGNSLNINGQADMSNGYWYSSQENGQYCFEFKGSKGSSNWNMTRCFDKSQFQKKGNETYVMTREAGTLQLTGNLEAEVGQGKYTFTEDAAFKKYLADNNITTDEQNLLFHLFFANVDKNYISYLKKNYEDVEGEQLQKLAIFNITQHDFQQYVDLFQKYSNKKPSVEDVVAARIHGIDAAYVQELQGAGFKDLSMQKMMEAKIHGVDAAYIKSMQQAGFGNLSIDKIIQTKIHGVNPATMKEMQALGYGDLSLDKIIELKIHGVDKEFIRELQAAGFDKLTLDQVVQAKIFGLNSASAKEIRALGFKDLSFQDMVNARIHDVDAAYVQDLKKAGFTDLSMEDAVSAKIHGIDSNFIKKAKQEGYNLNSLDKYIALKIHGMAMESLKEKD
ncbi:M56 family metallopeptidase [Pontibacter sp. 172403-2]|uniref:M56 family metallopeptidase n=1 Tax=Pontibacter rufus TaxID=2791028 RepID=UPI0018AF916B|nr:M56 family metallopeptidase [Pontibacter sp. 172403-2]MBF9255781.1 M56 family metallopeptidase [Pontibacter sp. 172403-2]